MILTKKDRFDIYFIKQPLPVRLLLILTVSIFFPLYITIPIVVTVCIFIIRDDEMRKSILVAPDLMLYAFMGLLLLVVPLIYNNYVGFFCGILVIMFFVLEFYIRRVMTKDLFNTICTLCCGMSLFCAAIAAAEKLFGIQIRVDALTGNANYYAYLIELMVIICFYKFVTTKKLVYIFIFAVNIAALILTGCRSAWLALLIGLLIFSLIQKNKTAFIVLTAISLTLAAAIYFNPDILPRYDDLDFSLIDRLTIWRKALADFFAHPFFGRGLFAYSQISGSEIQPHAHNIFIECLESTGIVGTSIAVLYIGSVLRDLAVSWKSGNEKIKARVALCAGLIAATFTHGITDAPIMGAQTGLFFILALSLRPRVTAPVTITEMYPQKYRVLESVSDPLKAKMFRFMEFRVKIKSPMTEEAVEVTLRELRKLSSDENEQIAILNQSIVQGYMGVFALKKQIQRPTVQRGNIP